MKLSLLLLSLISFMFLQAKAYGKDFGIQGNTFVIVEIDMIELIKGKLNALEATGELALKNKEMEHKVRSYLTRPLPVQGIAETVQRRVRLIDPTYVVPEDIHDQDGKLLHTAGTKINPLNQVPLSSLLLFIDGDKKSQVTWAIKTIKAAEKPVKLVLVKGEPKKIMQKHNIRAYFDQKGLLCKKLEIKFVPTLIRQKGNQLEAVEEVIK